MYEMICGKPPFDKKVSTATLMAQVHEAPPPISERNPGAPISPAMEAIVMRCLEKNPDNRFSSMREVLGHLKVAAGEDPLEATRTSRIDLGPMPSRPSLTPLPAATASTPRAAMASAPRVEDSLVPAQPPTFSPVPAPRRRSSSTTYVVAVAAALAGGGLALLAAGRGKQDAAAPTRVESVVVPVAVPAAAAMESNPAAGIRLVRIESNPPGARVSDRGTEVCLATPCRIVLQGEGINAEYRLDLTRGGYRPAVLVVRPSDETASIDLEPVAGDVRVAAAAAPEARATTEPEAPGASTAIAPPQAVEPAAAAAPTPAPAATAEAPPPAQTEQAAAPASPAAAAATSKVLPFQDGMSRPVPLSPPAPVYTREARAARVQGTVIAKCVITASGSLTGCRIIKGLPHMNEAVLAALQASRYRPVTFQGRPVAVDYVFSIKIVPP
jgi:serine/threonine-protein kinase